MSFYPAMRTAVFGNLSSVFRLPTSGSRLPLVIVTASALHLALVFLVIEGQWKIIVVALGAVAVLSLLLLRPATCLLLLFAYLPFQSLINDVFARVTSLVAVGKDVLFVMVIVSLVGHHFLRRQSWYINAPMYWLFLFALVGAFLALLAPDPIRGVLALRSLALYPLLIVLAANALETEADLQRLLRLLAIVGLVTVGYGILQYFTLFDVPYRTSGGDVTLRMGRFDDLAVVSTFASRPAFGGWLVAIFLLLLNIRSLGTKLSRPMWRWAALGATLLCVLLTYSRTTWLALLVGLLVTLWLKDKLKATFCALALGLCLILFYATQEFFASASLSEAATSSESMAVRLSYWPMVFRHVLAQPLGLGLGTVGGPHLFEAGAQADVYGNLQYDQSAAFDPQAGLGPGNMLTVTDNTFLKLLVQGGLPLFVPFMGMLLVTLRLLTRTLQETRAGRQRELVVWIAGSLAALMTIFMFMDFLESGPPIALYWLAIGILCCLRKFSDESSSSSRAVL
jgi:O-antigen ligase